MRDDRHIALKLRRQGKSYNTISRELSIPKSTLSEWFSSKKWSIKIKKELIRKVNYASKKRLLFYALERKLKWENWRESARQEARRNFPALAKNPLFVAGTMLYWAEGDNKPKNPFRLTNTDPRMIALYTKFLTKILRVPKENLRATMILYPDLSEKQCLRFWSKIIGIPKSQFYKTQFIKGRHPTKRLSNGICMIVCGNRQLKEKVITWIDLISKHLRK